jgi:hypothetical protein
MSLAAARDQLARLTRRNALADTRTRILLGDILDILATQAEEIEQLRLSAGLCGAIDRR